MILVGLEKIVQQKPAKVDVQEMGYVIWILLPVNATTDF